MTGTRPALCAHHASVLATLDHPNGERPVIPADTRDVWATQLAAQCCRPAAAKPSTIPPEERQP